jgi:hypothetical protein
VKPLTLVLGLGVAAAASPAIAQTTPQLPESGAPSTTADTRTVMWRVEMGYRGSYLPSAGYDPFSTNDLLPQFSLAATRTIWNAEDVSFAPGLAWDFGSAGATSRGDTTTLTMNRLTVPLEGRLHFGQWGYAFLRAAPGIAAVKVQVNDSSSPDPLTRTRWLFATDLSAGYAWLVWPKIRAATSPRLWFQGDGGYGFVADDSLTLVANSSSSSSLRSSSVDLGTLSMSGGFFRLAAALSF